MSRPSCSCLIRLLRLLHPTPPPHPEAAHACIIHYTQDGGRGHLCLDPAGNRQISAANYRSPFRYIIGQRGSPRSAAILCRLCTGITECCSLYVILMKKTFCRLQTSALLRAFCSLVRSFLLPSFSHFPSWADWSISDALV